MGFGRIAFLTAISLGVATAGQQALPDCANFLPYSPDPQHIWNRVHCRLLERRDRLGKAWGCDDVDPLLWYESNHLLVGNPYREAVRLLDEFTSTHAERLIRAAPPRAMFQRDLWAVFDWLAGRPNDHSRERAQLQRRLATIIKAVALTPAEIRELPDKYASLRGSRTADGFALPDPADGWLLIGRDDGTPAAQFHSYAFPRSSFLVYLKLPPGGPTSVAYLKAMRAFSGQRSESGDCMMTPCNPPQFPVGTELALVRRALLVDTDGRPVVSPITESVQLRLYREIPTRFTVDYSGVMQRTAEFPVARRALQQGAPGLRRVGNDEAQFQVFSAHGMDLQGPTLTIRGCHICHQGIGVISFTTYSRAQFASRPLFIMIRAGKEAEENAAAVTYLQSRDSWKLLQKLMR